MFISAPLWCRYFTVSKWPLILALMRGVYPSYMSNKKKWEDAHNGQAHRGDRTDTYIILYVHISTALVQILYSFQVAIDTGIDDRCATILYAKQKEVRGCTQRPGTQGRQCVYLQHYRVCSYQHRSGADTSQYPSGHCYWPTWEVWIHTICQSNRSERMLTTARHTGETERILTISCLFISAPLWCRYFTVSKWPLLLTKMRGVDPSYM
jgi:hypothetical protein